MSDLWKTVCQRVTPQVLEQRDWQLITDLTAFSERVAQAIAQGTVRPSPGMSDDQVARRATTHIYCQELYWASGQNGTLRQHRAFQEIGRYIQIVAQRYEHDPNIIQECIQQTLVIFWEKREQIRNPGSLLRWVEMVIYREIKRHWRQKQRKREIVAGDNMAEDKTKAEDKVEHFWNALRAHSSPDEQVVDRELREQLWIQVQHALAGHPRQQAVIIGYYMYELGFLELANMLNTSVSNVHLIKCRALKRLRQDQAFIQYFADALETLAAKPGGER